eukprot:1768987-Amphidinium_carterae.1
MIVPRGVEREKKPVAQLNLNLLKIYENDALSRAQRAQSLDETIAQMEEEHKAFHEAIEQGIRQSAAAAKAKAKSEPTPTLLSQLPVERAEQVVEKYVTEASDRLAILMKLNGTVPEVNLRARVPMGHLYLWVTLITHAPMLKCE